VSVTKRTMKQWSGPIGLQRVASDSISQRRRSIVVPHLGPECAKFFTECTKVSSLSLNGDCNELCEVAFVEMSGFCPSRNVRLSGAHIQDFLGAKASTAHTNYVAEDIRSATTTSRARDR
jgi:hypothetical protein